MQLLNEAIEKIKREPRLLEIVMYPDESLFKSSALVASSIPDDKGLQELLQDMEFTMQNYHAVGLAAIQVGVPLKVFVIQDEERSPIKVINPVIKSADGSDFSKEGCLSMPGVFERIVRAEEIVVSYFDETGKSVTSAMDGLMARAFQHEYEHLEGKMFVDKMNFVQKEAAMKKFKKIKRVLRNS